MLDEQILVDLKQAMLSGDSTAVSVLRMLKSEIHNAGIAQGGSLDDDAKIKVVRREIKKRTEAALAFRNAGQEDRAAAEEAEAGVLQKYLPAAVDPAILEETAKRFLEELPDRSPRQKGVLIQRLLQEFAGRVEGSEVSALVNKLLA